jgi:hypothetical protein
MANPRILASGETASEVWPGVNIETVNQITSLQLTADYLYLEPLGYDFPL